MAKPKGHYVGRAFQYNEFELETGQVFEPRGSPNDAVLIGNRYLIEISDAYPTGYEAYTCVRCSKVFVAPEYKLMHDSRCPEQVLDTDTTPGAEVASSLALVGQTVSE